MVVGNQNGQFNSPIGIAIDENDKIYVSDDTRIQKFDSFGSFILKIGPDPNPMFFAPKRMTVDSDNNLFVINTGLKDIQIFNENGDFQKQFGSLGSGQEAFEFLLGITSDTKGNFFVSDVNPGRIQTFVLACFPPSIGDWIVDSSCSIIEDSLIDGNLIIQDSSLLTIPSGKTLTIASGNNLTVKHHSGVLIKSSGTLQIIS